MDLGQLISTLEQLDQNMSVRHEDYSRVRELDSYRGYYDHLAIGSGDPWNSEKEIDTVADLLEECREAVGSVFHGYKGGEYEMSDETPIWIANGGEATGIELAGIMLNSDSVILVGKKSDW